MQTADLLIDPLVAESLNVSYLAPGHGCFQDGVVTHWRILPCTAVAQPYQGVYEIQKQNETSRFTETNGAFLIGADQAHRIVHHGDPSHNGEMRSRWVHVHYTFFGSVDITAFLEMPLILEASLGVRLCDIIEELTAFNSSLHLKSLIEISRKKEIAFRLLSLICEVSTLKPEAVCFYETANRLAPVLTFIKAHLAESFSIHDLAELAHLSVPRFHAVFRETLSKSPMEYVKLLRFNEARYQLAWSDRLISQIAAQAGYPDAFYFSRLFKATFGVSPGEFRRTNKRFQP